MQDFPDCGTALQSIRALRAKQGNSTCCQRGFWRLLVPNIKEPEALSSCRRSYCSETAHSVSCKNRKATGESAAQPALSPRLLSVGSGQRAHGHTFFVANETLTALGAERKTWAQSACVNSVILSSGCPPLRESLRSVR